MAFQQAGLNAFLALQQISDQKEKLVVIDFAIRNVLESIVQTARSFDGARPETQYSGSLMLFRPSLVDIETKTPVFQFDGYDERQLAGYLELMPELSTSKERAFVPLVLPVHKETKKMMDYEGKERFRVLPGAPWAYPSQERRCRGGALDHYAVRPAPKMVPSSARSSLGCRWFSLHVSTREYRRGAGGL
ncbi:hypothetical protein RN01_07320 [Cupriavidus sp. SHE]|uniref:hypothetical protein n=1 Tax=Cupriavidus TaxID=106589 RepID=UPI00046B7367|nr:MULTISPECIES: hypothetical protein [Cupriavidus]KWR84307.1 hypothetical protein RN01_07320 [Cupriavidus sp. SHE]